MKAEGYDVVEDGRRAWDNIDEIYYEETERYYTLHFEDGTSEVFGGYIDFIGREE